LTGGMMLRVLTVATDPTEKNELRLMAESSGQAIVVLAENPYYESLESAMKIRKYVKQRNVAQLPKSVQDIIRDQQDEAGKYELTAADSLADAITSGVFYVDGERIEIKAVIIAVSIKENETPEQHASNVKKAKAKNVIDQALENLVTHVYSDLGLITKFAETDADIYKILHGDEPMLPGTEPNRDAAAKVEKYLEIQFNQNLPTTMSDLQDRFQKKPYGWREIDIAAVVAMLIYDQKVTIKYGGATIQPSDPKLPDMLRKKSEIGKTSISKRQVVSIQKIREVRDFLRDFFDEMDVPEDEDGLIAHIVEKFNGELNHYTELDARYDGHKYPDQGKVKQAIALVKDVLSQQKDNTALIQRLIDREDFLYDMRDQLQEVEEFFKTRVTLFDAAVQYERDLSVDRDYIAKDDEAHHALNQIRLITMIPTGGKFKYDRIPELNDLMAKVKASHGAMLAAKREELLEIVRQCMEEIHTLAGDHPTARNISNTADNYFTQKKQQIASYQTLALLDGLVPPIWQYKDDTVSRIEAIVNPPVKPVVPTPGPGAQPQPKKEVIKAIHRQALFPAKTLKTEEEIDTYVEKIRANMKQLLKGCDGIKLN
nr:BREX system P-loop protein BrxC [Oscillospiraceae bacterium]